MKINKLIASLLAVSLLAFPVVQVSADENISLTVNGEKVETQVPPTIIDGRTMVPVRDIFEACGAKVNWDANTKTITGEKGNTTVVMQIDSNMLFINEDVTEMDATPVIIDGRTLAPARYVAESFGGIVDWDAENKVVFDLYCGTGTIGQIAAPNAKKVVGLELIEEAVEAAKENALRNGLSNCKFIAGDVFKVLKLLKKLRINQI